MSVRHLEAFFDPESIAVIGDFAAPDATESLVLRNLLEAGYAGRVMVCSRKHKEVEGIPCHSSVSRLPELPELSILCVSPYDVARVLNSLGKRGAKAALVLSGGFSRGQSKSERVLVDSILSVIREHGIRVLGPNSLGLLVPGARLNASTVRPGAARGRVAYVGYSGILGLAMLDWAGGRGVGFSHFLTLGDQYDVSLADLVNYLAEDPGTRAIILQIERIDQPREFLSAIRIASRGKLVLVIKSGLFAASRGYEVEPVPGLGDSEEVISAALRRAGALRIEDLEELFDATETLTRMRPLQGERLAMISNGFGPNVLATDQLILRSGQLAELAPETVLKLSKVLPRFWNQRNPVDINGDATPQRFAEALKIIGRDPGVDAVLVTHAPTEAAPGVATAEAVAPVARDLYCNVLCSWMGKRSASEARRLLESEGLPTYASPGKAVSAFMYMVQHRRSQEALSETPPLRLVENAERRLQVLEPLHTALSQSRTYLRPDEVREVLRAYGIPYADARYVNDIHGAEEAARELGYPVAVRIVHEAGCMPFVHLPGRVQRTAAVAMDVRSPEQLQYAIVNLSDQVAYQWPDSRILGYEVQCMQRGLHSLKVGMGVSRDPLFGPVLFFGGGGAMAEIRRESAIGLPPLNHNLAEGLIAESRIAGVLAARGSEGQRALDKLAELLVNLSQLVVDVSRISGVEIRPILVNQRGVMAASGYIGLGEPAEMAIRPYPEELEEPVRLEKSGREVVLRPIRGEDEPAHYEMHQQLSQETIFNRFFQYRSKLTHRELARMTQIDYDREMAFIASAQTGDGGQETLGVVRTWCDADFERAEFAIVVRDDQQGEGLGRKLMEKAIAYCRGRGIQVIFGDVLAENRRMLAFVGRFGFEVGDGETPDVVRVTLRL